MGSPRSSGVKRSHSLKQQQAALDKNRRALDKKRQALNKERRSKLRAAGISLRSSYELLNTEQRQALDRIDKEYLVDLNELYQEPVESLSPQSLREEVTDELQLFSNGAYDLSPFSPSGKRKLGRKIVQELYRKARQLGLIRDLPRSADLKDEVDVENSLVKLLDLLTGVQTKSGARETTQKRRRGRPVDTDVAGDVRIWDAWQSGAHRTKAELANALGLKLRDVGLAINRHGKRRNRPKPKSILDK